ncbi:gamma-crystallin 2-like [Spea bombifrons]|uniref:gamma-crystallin 2-like n=1 Tax=Spea bombifrons TaxID=233779 RepID=UPI00234A8132|nr:gamma-crystallin 2-like [Spea bombifrons]
MGKTLYCVKNIILFHLLGVSQIIFYEDKHFKGQSFECTSDQPDLPSHFSHCKSIKVDNGCWIVYELPGYRGEQYFLENGEYPDFQCSTGHMDFIRSCHMVPHFSGPHRLKVYERDEFRGQMMEFTEDCPSVYDRFLYQNIYSCNILLGYWIFYEQPSYKGKQYYLKPGEYRRFNDWGASDARVGSFRRILDIQ